MYYTKFRTSFCDITLVGTAEGLMQVYLHTQDSRKKPIEMGQSWKESYTFFEETIQQIEEFLVGQRKNFTIKTLRHGTKFQQMVWDALCEIPYGETRTYQDIARRIGNPKAVRAVGAANARNLLSLVVPCHRVIGVKGRLTGFASGLVIKEKLLKLEGYSQISQ